MTALALALVLGSAVLHAGWNLLAKRAGGGAAFVWLFSTLTVAAYGPAALAYALATRPRLEPAALGLALGSSALHVAYFVSLQRGYRVGDLSVVYPVARGTGPAVAALLAWTVIREPFHPGAAAGAALVVVSVFLVAGGRLHGVSRPGLGYGLATGLVIGCYTAWDGSAVSRAGIAPILFLTLSEAGRSVLLAPLAWRRRHEVRQAWRSTRREALGIALLSPLAYLLVLTAMTLTPISRVAPAREVSILLGAVLGQRLLDEGGGVRRLLGAAGMVAGVAVLVLA